MEKVRDMLKRSMLVLIIGFIANGNAHPVSAQKAKQEVEQKVEQKVGQIAGQATYLANEGVMIAGGGQKIVFDPFFHNDFGYYSLVPKHIRKALFEGTAPYDNINAVFISHAHEDHFSAVDMNKYLQAHPKVHLYAPLQAVKQMVDLKGSEQLMKRVTAIALEYGAKPWSNTLGRLNVEAVRIPHSGGEGRRFIQNMVFRVSLNDKVTVIHMGDADPKDRYFAHYLDFWQMRVTDVSFPPYWFFASKEGNKILNERINAKHHIGVHVPKVVPKGLAQSGLDIFTIPGEIRQIKQ